MAPLYGRGGPEKLQMWASSVTRLLFRRLGGRNRESQRAWKISAKEKEMLCVPSTMCAWSQREPLTATSRFCYTLWRNHGEAREACAVVLSRSPRQLLLILARLTFYFPWPKWREFFNLFNFQLLLQYKLMFWAFDKYTNCTFTAIQ